MARTVAEIERKIKDSKEASDVLKDKLTSGSGVSIWGALVYIISIAIHTLERVFDTHKEEVNKMIGTQITGTARWYKSITLSFLIGYKLTDDGKQVKQDGTTGTDEERKNARIIKHASVVEIVDERKLIIKALKEDETTKKKEVLTTEEQTRLKAFLNRVKFAGTFIEILSIPPNALILTIEIYRAKPFLIDDKGTAIEASAGGVNYVNDAIDAHLNNLGFDGNLTLQGLVDSIQILDAVDLVNLKSAKFKVKDSDTKLITIELQKVPPSGFFKFDENNSSIIYK